MRTLRKSIVLGMLALLRVRAASAQTPYTRPYAQPSPAPMQAGGLYPPQAQPAPRPPPNMQSGGLAPPSAFPQFPTAPVPTGSSPTQATLEEAERRDAGRGLEFFYVTPEVGAKYVALDALHGPFLPAGVKSSAFGLSVGTAAGVKLLFLSIGPRVRFAHFARFDLITVDLEIGWHVPLGNVEPYALIGVGYSKLTVSAPTDTIDGYDFKLGGGIDYYVISAVSLGGAISTELFRLKRHGDGYGLGLGITPTAVLGLHF